MDIELNSKNSVSDKILRLIEVMNENGIPISTLAYRISKEDAAVLADEIIHEMEGVEKDALMIAIEHGYAHRKLHGGSYCGLLLVAKP